MQLKELRKSKGVTQRQIANACKVTESAVSQWENGSTLPTVNNLCSIAETLNCSINDVFNCFRKR